MPRSTRVFPICRRAGLALMLALIPAHGALAEDPPLDLHAQAAPAPTPPTKPTEIKASKPAKGAKEPTPAAKPDLTSDEIIAKADGWLDDARVMTADFVQIGPDGARTEGKLYVARPGHLLFHYNPPSPLEIVADGRSVAVRDQNLGTQDLYFIAQTPLKFLLADHIDLAKDVTIKRIDLDENAATIEIEDKATFGGKSEISLVFDPNTFALKQWTVLDAQGFQTVVTLFDIDLVTPPDPALFHIDDTVATSPSKRR